MKNLEISKELIKAVLEKEVASFEDDFEFAIEDNCIVFSHDGEIYFEFNIYEFTFMCKEWVNKQGYWANSGYDNKYYCMLRDMPDNKWFYADTEVEAIFKACEWVIIVTGKQIGRAHV